VRLEQWFYALPLRLRSLLRRSRVEAELDEELRGHLEHQAQAFVERGMSPEEARWAALRAMGNVESHKEECREARGVRLLEDLVGDVRYTLRGIRRNPSFAAVVVVSLALGIGANSAIFSVLDAVLLARLPVRDPDKLVLLTWSAPRWPDAYVDDLEGSSYKTGDEAGTTSYSFPSAAFHEFERRTTQLASVVGFAANDEHVNIGLNGRADDALVQAVSGGYFEAMGVVPALGRLILPADDTDSAPPVAVVSYRFWQRKLGSDPAVAGRPIVVNGTPVTVAGVAAPEFFGFERGNPPDLWLPLSFYSAQWARLSPEERLDDPRVWWMGVIGRLKPGATREQAAAELGTLFSGVLTARPGKGDASPAPRLAVTPAGRGLEHLQRRFSTSLFLLMAMVGLLLAIACANVAGLLLARAAARRQEIATRLSLGAPRQRLVRQLLVESTVLALLGGAAGLAVAYWAAAVLVGFFAESRNRILLDVRLDGRVLLFTAVVSVGCGVFFGLAPALRLTRSAALSPGRGDRRTGLAARSRSGKVLVALQVGLGLVLLVGSGLMLGTLRRLQSVDVGFPRERLLVFDVKPGLNSYEGQRLANYYEELTRRVAAIPGVESVAFSLLGPIGSGESSGQLEIPGVSQPGARLDYHRHIVSPGYFEALGVPLLAGRSIGAQDTPTAPRVAVVNRTFVEQYFHGANPLGHVLRQGSADKPFDAEVVGIVGDVRYNQVRNAAPPTAYFSYRQASPRPDYVPFFMNYLVRTKGDPRSVQLELQRAALALDKDVPLVNVRSEETVIEQVLFLERAFDWLTTAFGAVALVLAGVGLYGTISYTVAQRTNEIGVRIALGATRATILVWVLRQTTLVVLAGLAAGIPLAWAATRLLRSHLFELSPNDPATLLAAVGAILAASLAAILVPARRATRVDPVVALRYE
jgi:predicted permease